jgi:hypothetical protein
VLLLGLASAAVYYLAFTRQWPLDELYLRPHLDYAWLTQYTREGQFAFLGSFLLLFGLQYAAYRLVRTVPVAAPLWLILTGQLLFGLLLVWIYPVVALDIYDYLMYGRITLVYGGNPFTQPPERFPDPLVGFSPWPREASVYGPLWQLASLVPTALAGDSILRGMILFKLVALGLFVACAGMIWRLLRVLHPALAPAGTLLFAWNPLLHFELAGNAHNDAGMVLLVLFAVWALLVGPRLAVLPLFAAAVLTKLLAIALGPIFLAGLLRAPGSRRDRAIWVLGGGALALGLVMLAYAPFWEGTQTLYFLTRGNWFTASFPTMLREYLRLSMEFEAAGRLAAMLVGAAFALFVLARVAIYWRQAPRAPDPRVAWIAAAHDVTFVYLAFACLWWEPWYLTWLVAFAALTPSRVIHERALLFCYGGVINYVVFQYIWPVFQPMTYAQIMGISVLAIFGPVLLHLACTAADAAPLRRAAREQPA